MYDPEAKKLSSLVSTFHNELFKGPNDLDFDAEGNLYFTDPWGTGPGPDATDRSGAIYQYSKDGILRRVISTGSFPNGIAVSPDDSTLAVADYASNRMLYYSFLTGPRPACSQCGTDASHTTFCFATEGSYNPGNGGPDGIHYDVHGNLWAACGIGGRIEYDSRGFIIGYVPRRTAMRRPQTLPLAARTTRTSTWKAPSVERSTNSRRPIPLIGPGGERMSAQH